MKGFLAILLLVVAVSASEVKKVVETKHVSYGANKGYGGDKSYGYASVKTYHGKYGGKCGNDGFYFNNADSFVICSNGNAYVQPCAPGSKNSGYDNYHYGSSYNYRDFCDINLVDDGYGAKHGYNGGYNGNAYGGYGYNKGYGGPAYGGHAGYGGYGDGYGYGYNSGYGYNDGYRGNHGYGGYGNPGHQGGYQKTEYTRYEAPAKGYTY